ncbi:sulfite exporter TauE/SafE family protein [Ramlibacter sp. PS4R-6]|uniref:sulfite exporter TauE/SafE family protein n=1 Tax=Ramlibacter sp. PS4R-6 TaxID=3133438 RepID=UPI0030AB80B9
MTFDFNPMLATAGAFTGVLVGLTGVGGGSVMTPILLLIFGTAPMAAVGTDLWFAAFTKIAATKVHSARGLIDWQVVRRLWLGSLPASAATMWWLSTYPVDAHSTEWVKGAIAMAILVTATAMLFQEQLHELGRRLRIGDAETFKALQPFMTVACGATLGFLVTLTSIGAGALGVVFLAYLYPLRLTSSRLIATDIVHAIPLAMFAGMGHLVAGHVDLNLLGNLLIGSLPGVVVGALLSSKLPQVVLRRTLSAILVFIGVKLLHAAG